MHCVITYWVQAWTKSQRVTGQSCHPVARTDPVAPARADPVAPSAQQLLGHPVVRTDPVAPSTQQLLGGSSEADPTEKSVLDAADFAVADLNSNSNHMYHAQLLDVKHASKQVCTCIYSMVVFLFCRHTSWAGLWKYLRSEKET